MVVSLPQLKKGFLGQYLVLTLYHTVMHQSVAMIKKRTAELREIFKGSYVTIFLINLTLTLNLIQSSNAEPLICRRNLLMKTNSSICLSSRAIISSQHRLIAADYW